MIIQDKFIKACIDGDIAVVRQYIAESRDIEVRDNYGWTALMYASLNGRTECVRELIKAGADVNIKDSEGRTALIYTAAKGYAGCLRELINAGADVNAADGIMGWTPLIYVVARTKYDVNIECMQELISHGAYINAKDINGKYALTYLLINKSYNAAQLLIELGADIYAKNRFGRQAIDYCKNKEVKSRLTKLSQRHIRAAVKSADKPDIIQGFDTER